MNKLLQVALNDLRVTFRERGIWINLALVPCVLIFAVGLANGAFDSGDSQPRVLIDVYDADASDVSAAFLDELRRANPTLVLCPMDDQVAESGAAEGDDAVGRCALSDEPLDAELSLDRLDNGTIEAILEIPADFGGKVVAGEPVDVVYRSDEDPLQPSALLQSVQAALQPIGGASAAASAGIAILDSAGVTIDDETAVREAINARAAALWAEQPITIAYTQTSGEETTDTVGGVGAGFNQSVPGMGTMYVMFTVIAGVFLLLVERKNWTLQRLVAMPVTRGQLLGGKILARFVMGMIQYAIAFGFGLLLGVWFNVRIDYGRDPLALVLLMTAFTLSISALTFLLATFVENEQQANGVTTFVTLIAAPLGGAWWPLEIVPDAMRIAGHISPVAWVMDGFSKLMFYNGTLIDVLPEIGVLLAIAGVLFMIALPRFRYE
jgi:ABC-2 type transport system permease protein